MPVAPSLRRTADQSHQPTEALKIRRAIDVGRVRLSPATPILMTTGYNDQMALEGPQAEAMDVLGKPYKPAELIDRVQTALRNGARTGPGRQRSDFGHAES